MKKAILFLLTMCSSLLCHGQQQVSFEETYYNALILTNVKINNSNIPLKFIFDTGSSKSFISKKALKLFTDLKTIKLETEISDGYNKKRIDESVIFNTIDIDGIVFRNHNFSIDTNYLSSLDCDVAGIIGYDLIKKKGWYLSDSTISILDAPSDLGKTMLGNFYKQKITESHGVPTFNMNFGNYFSTSLLFDTGYNDYLVINKELFGKSLIDVFVKNNSKLYIGKGIQRASSFGYIGDSSSRIELLKVPEIHLGKRTHKKIENKESKLFNCLVGVENEENVTLPYLFGARMLEYYDIILDPRKKAIYSKISNQTFNTSKSFGFSLIPIKTGEYRIGTVWENTMADSLLNPNELVTEINGIDLSDSKLEICNQYENFVNEINNKDSIQMKVIGLDKQTRIINLVKKEVFTN
jgi:hypothetical protein